MFCYTLAKVTKKYDIDPSKSKFIYLLSDRKSISTLLECEAHRQKPHKRRCVCFSSKDSESEIIRIQVSEFHQLSLSLKSNNKDKSMNMNKLKGLLIMMIGSIFGGCIQPDGIHTMNANTFEKAIQAPDVQLIDVRTADEFAAGKIGNAANIDVLQPEFLRQVQAKFSTEKPVFVYCRSGKRSLNAARKLQKAGFTVNNLQGGILEWEQAGKPIASSDTKL